MEAFYMTKIIRKRINDLTQVEIQSIFEINNKFGGLIFHEIQFNLIVQETFRTELTYWVAISETGKVIGFCPMHTVIRGVLKYSYSSPTHFGVPFGGWVFDSAQITHDELIHGMKYGLNEIGVYFSSIQYPTDTFEKTMISVKRCSTPIIDLSMSEEEIWNKSLKSCRRSRVRKAQREGVVVKTYGSEGYDLFVPCQKDLHKKINMPDKPEEFYRKLLDYYAPKGQARIFIAEKDGEIFAGSIAIGNHLFMHFWEAAIKQNAPSIGLYEILYWENIVWAQKNGSAYFDLCVVDEENLPQIAFFKLEISNHKVPFYHFIASKISFRILAKLQKSLIRDKK
jgi:hypothetical protein